MQPSLRSLRILSRRGTILDLEVKLQVAEDLERIGLANGTDRFRKSKILFSFTAIPITANNPETMPLSGMVRRFPLR